MVEYHLQGNFTIGEVSGDLQKNTKRSRIPSTRTADRQMKAGCTHKWVIHSVENAEVWTYHKPIYLE
jgi:hypothetical protein